jgi:hypothetical protein
MKIKWQGYKPNGNNTDWKKPELKNYELKKLYGAFVKAFFTIRWFNDINKIGRMISWRKNKIMGIRKSR